MKLNKQVTSLKLSKKLKELGVPQESLFYWHEKSGSLDFYNHFSPTDRDYSAFTVAELVTELLKVAKKDTIVALENVTADKIAIMLINHYAQNSKV